MNNMVGMQLVSGHDCKEAVKTDNAAQSPPKRGRPSTVVSEEDFKDLCALLFSLGSVEQTNADPIRLDREGQTTLLGMIVQSKDGIEAFDSTALYKRILAANANVQDMVITDEREARRHQWLQHRTLQNHCEHWEAEVVRLGFARMPENEEEKQKGCFVFHEGQLRRIINLDECKVSLAGGKNDEHAGGRPGSTPSNPSMPDPGKAAEKSSKAVTICFGICGDEPLPPLIITPTSAKLENRKISAKHFISIPQLRGRHCNPRERCYDVSMSTSEHGSMTADICREWVNEKLSLLFPDAEDRDGKRIMITADGGPGRKHADCLARMALEGFQCFPKCPNTTEETQEMDQLFSALKGCIYRNREALYKARFAADGAAAKLDMEDVGCMVFGGEVRTLDTDGVVHTTLTLQNAFDSFLSPDHIRKAREKCGCFPATRAALRSRKVRHEINVDDEEGSDGIDEDFEPMGELLRQLEHQNHEMVAKLEAKGCTLASEAKRFVNRDEHPTHQQDNGTTSRTEPNTRERQLALEKAATFGQHFSVTEGGQVMTHADFLIGEEFKRMRLDAKAMESKKNRSKDSIATRSRQPKPHVKNHTVAGTNQTSLLPLNTDVVRCLQRDFPKFPIAK